MRSTLLEIEGQHRRQFVVCGTKGTIEIRPLEPAQVVLSLAGAREPYSKGRTVLDLPFKGGRYDAQLIHFAEMVRGRSRNSYSLSHELVLQEALLKSAGLSIQ